MNKGYKNHCTNHPSHSPYPFLCHNENRENKMNKDCNNLNPSQSYCHKKKENTYRLHSTNNHLRKTIKNDSLLSCADNYLHCCMRNGPALFVRLRTHPVLRCCYHNIHRHHWNRLPVAVVQENNTHHRVFVPIYTSLNNCLIQPRLLPKVKFSYS